MFLLRSPGLPNPFIVTLGLGGWRSVLTEIAATNRQTAELPKFQNRDFLKGFLPVCKSQLVRPLYNT